MIRFQKYHGNGNSFIIINNSDLKFLEWPSYLEFAKNICDNDHSIGADGLIIYESPNIMHIYNKDGSEAKMCGNGIRCFGYYLYRNGYQKNQSMIIKTLLQSFKLEILEENKSNALINVNMGLPNFSNELMEMKDSVPLLNLPIDYEGTTLIINNCFMTTMHTILFVNEFDINLIKKWSEFIIHHNIYFNGTNVDFVKIKSKDTLEIITFERGVGFTKACGSGACASFVIANMNKMVNETVKVYSLDNNDISKRDVYLTICFNEQKEVIMNGDAEFICNGEIY